MKLLNVFEGFEEFVIKSLVTVAIGFLAPLKTWIVAIEFFVFAEYLTQRMLQEEKHEAKYYFIKATLYLVILMQAKGLEAMFFPQTPITQYCSAIILVYQFKLSLKNVSEYAGVNILERLTEVLQNIVNEMIKYKKPDK